jgi:transcriptional regulator with XRE-family HTH domain
LENIIDLAKYLKELRLSSGMSQSEFAKMLGISQTTWSAYERGDTRPKLPLLIALEAQGYKIEGLTTDAFQSIKGRSLGVDLNDMGVTKEDAKRKLELASHFPPNIDIDEASKLVDEKYRRELAQTAATLKIPMLRQKVSCGSGADWESEENIEEYIEVQTLIPRLGIGRIFAVKAQGSSMLGAGIHEGDYVFFDGNAEQLPHDGIYVFALDGEVYCKRLEFDRLSRKVKIFSVRVSDLEKAELVVSLSTEDSSFADRFCIFGKVTRCIRVIEVGE